MRKLTPIAIPLLTACAGAGGADTGVGIDTGAVDGVTGVEVSVSVADTSLLPTDRDVSFDVRRQPDGGGELVQMGSVAIDETARFEVEPGSWRIFASFSWEDPSKEDTDTQDTGGYWATECSGRVEVDVAAGAITPAPMAAECGDEDGD